MSSKLMKQIVDRPPRETSGSRSANRFDFQKNWIICRILDLHLNDKAYLIVCDYHEDVVQFDKEIDPSSVSYYQIKTLTAKNWTVSALLSRSKGKDGKPLDSILGKLYSNHLITQNATESLNFVSNALFKMKLNNDKDSLSLNKIACRELSDEEKVKITEKLAVEFDGKCSLPDEPVLFFEVTPLSVQDHSGHTKGKVAEFLNVYIPGKSHIVVPLYKTLFDEVRRQTTYEGRINNFDDLKNKKGIGKSKVSEFLAVASRSVNFDEIWEEVRERLVSERVSPLDVRQLRSAWSEYEVARMDASNEHLQHTRSQVSAVASEILKASSKIKLTDLMEQVLLQANMLNLISSYSSDYIKAMLLLDVYENA